MQKKPKVSVVLPFRNAEETLKEAVKSILDQSFSDFELLLVDNASTDGSVKIAEGFAHQDARIRLLTEPNVGLVYGLNAGLKHAQGEYIARMDADDIAYPKRLELQHKFLVQNPSVDVVATQVAFESGNESKGIQAYIQWSNQLISHEEIQLNRFVDAPLIHPTVMFRQDLISEYGNYRYGDFPEDFELWLRWLEKGVHFYKLPQSLLYWRDHPHRLTRVDPRYRTEAFYQVKSEYLSRWLRQHNPFHPEVVVWGAGRKSRQRVKLLEKTGIYIKAYIDVVANRTRTKPCIHYQDIEAPGKYFILSYLSNRGQRSKIKTHLLQKSYREGIDFLLVG